MKLKCNHCKNEWDYKGKSKFYCTCSKCLYKVNILKSEIKKNETPSKKN